MEHNANLHSWQKEVLRIEKELDQFIDAILAGTPPARVKDRMQILEDRLADLKERLEKTEEAPVLFHPNMSQRYHKEVRQLIKLLDCEETRPEAAELLRSLIDKIVLTPTEARERLTVDLVGDLAGILSVATKRDKSLINNDLSGFQPMQQEAMVAGAGFEPATFRL